MTGVRQDADGARAAGRRDQLRDPDRARCSTCCRRRTSLFELALYPQLARRGQLGAYVTDHRYYSVGSLERLPATERFLARRPTVILDRDGTLNRRPPRGPVRHPPGRVRVAARLARGAPAARRGRLSRGRGLEPGGDRAGCHDRGRPGGGPRADARGRGRRRSKRSTTAPTTGTTGCECRKPAPGMLFQAQRDLDLDLTRTLFIGDDERDGQAARGGRLPVHHGLGGASRCSTLCKS